MNELKKGDLVMTQYGLGYLDDYWQQNNQWEIILLNGKIAFVQHPTKATRTQVEAYLKEKGWNCNRLGNWVNGNYHYWVKDDSDEYCVKEDGGLYEDDFDTAPTQLAEAILMVKLLNATKD